ncbi:hypothetical protein C176_02189 [Viridibacillus arenosi FSL R5-213]|uniref:Uncharacterized protein n=1 Tax=Viridibacillus arenosi FSL R5-213 TaxID=1227360 RepID=W4F5A1_9BACL|nr:hypothetical protein C176_02189 [Viridibacillus arenosi FSL R5-213]
MLAVNPILRLLGIILFLFIILKFGMSIMKLFVTLLFYKYFIIVLIIAGIAFFIYKTSPFKQKNKK